MSTPSIDFQELKKALNPFVNELIFEIAPGGKLVGREYQAASIYGGAGSSFSFNLDSQKWADFANPEHKGGDIISLYAVVNNITQIEAAKTLAKQINYKPQYEINHNLPNLNHAKYGKPAAHWEYRNEDNYITHLVVRYNLEDGKKTFSQWHFDYETKKWVPKTTKITPLYNLDKITKHPTKRIIITEGEKAADAAQKLLGNTFIATCWLGGAQAVRKVNLAPILNRDVVIWPDNDEPGQKCMNYIFEQISPFASKIKMIQYALEDQKAMDAADLIGLPQEVVNDFLKKRTVQLKPFIKNDLADVDDTQTLSFESDVSPTTSVESPTQGPTQGPTQVPTQTSAFAEIVETARFTQLIQDAHLDMATKTKVACTEDNILRVMAYDKKFHSSFFFDEFYKNYFETFTSETPQPIDDFFITNLKIYLQRTYQMRNLSTSQVESALLVFIHNQPKRNQVAEQIASYKWDGVPRIDTFFEDIYGCYPSAYSKDLGRIFWLSIVYRACEPGCKMDTVVILEGAQGIKKSSSLELIGGKNYGVAGRDISSKDFFLKIRSKSIVEIAELNAFTKSDHNELKEIISTRTDEFRAPYAKTVGAHPRTCVFVGTTNEEHYLADETGARRYLPIKCNIVNFELLEQLLDQYYAEAYQRYLQKEDYWSYDKEAHKLITHEKSIENKDQDLWTEKILNWVSDVENIQTSTIVEHVLGIVEARLIDKKTSLRIGKIMRHAGFKMQAVRENDDVKKMWTRVTESKVELQNYAYKYCKDKLLAYRAYPTKGF